MLEPEDILDPEVYGWYLLSPRERWEVTLKLWDTFLMMGGSLDPEPDTQSIIYDPEAPASGVDHGRTGLHIIRRS